MWVQDSRICGIERQTLHEEHRSEFERDMRYKCGNGQEHFPSICSGGMGSTKERWKVLWFIVNRWSDQTRIIAVGYRGQFRSGG